MGLAQDTGANLKDSHWPNLGQRIKKRVITVSIDSFFFLRYKFYNAPKERGGNRRKMGETLLYKTAM